MSLPEACIRRPVMTTLITLSFIVFGMFAYRQLPVAALPRVDFPTINVQAQLPGASPETMAASVAAPLERQFSTISGITAMTSTSTVGSTSITLQFDLDRNIDGAALDVQAAISSAARRLPADLPNPPSFRKVNPADQPILFLVVTSQTLPLSRVQDYSETILQQQVSQIPGVAQVNIYGGQKYAVRIMANPDEVSARGLSFADIRAAIAAANSNQPTGSLLGQNQRVTIEASGQLTAAADYRPLIVSSKNGVPVRLEDIATVKDSVENDQTASWYNNDRSLILAVFRQSDANTVEVVDAIRSRIPLYRDQLPASINLHVLNDRSILFEVWLAMGALLAAPVYASSVVAIPLLQDRRVSVLAAVLTSWRVVQSHPLPMALWAALLMALTVLGLATGGLLVIAPWLAHASWHAYRDLISTAADAAAQT